MTIGNRIILAASTLIFAVMGAQALISSNMITAELKQSVTASIEAKAKSTLEKLDQLLLVTAADLTIIAAHRTIENYMTFRVFDNVDGMTENLSELDLFLARVYKAKPQYTIMQFTDRDGVILQMSDGIGTEQFVDFDTSAAVEYLERAVRGGDRPVFHRIRQGAGELVMVSAAAVVVNEDIEGLVWLYQSIDTQLIALFAEMASEGFAVVIGNSRDHVVANSPEVSGDAATALLRGENPDWVTIIRQQPELGWKIMLGTEESRAFAVVREINLTTAAMFIIALFIAVVVLLLVVRSITRPLKMIIVTMEEIAEGDGDLGQRLEGKGAAEVVHLAAAYNKFVGKVRDLVLQINDSMTGFITTVQRTTQIAERTSSESERQQMETDQVTVAVEQLSAAVQEIAMNAANAAGAASRADTETNSSRQIINMSLEAVDSLAERNNAAASMVRELAADSDDVGKVLEVIQTIAEQTNLLALNAAIEAARASEHGRGFAVVADEVRTLASRTQDSTEEIRKIIEHLQTGARNAEKVMQEGKKEADRNVQEAASAAKALDAIGNAIGTIRELNTQIATATEEQGAVTKEINRNVVNINEVGKHTAEGARESAQSSDELAQLAKNIQGQLQHFKC